MTETDAPAQALTLNGFHLALLALVTLNRQTGRPLLAFELEGD